MNDRRRTHRLTGALAGLALVLAGCGGASAAAPSGGSAAGGASTSGFPHRPDARVLTLEAAHPYRPVSVDGSSDDYHCTLVDPHLQHAAYITGTRFLPDSPEVHHAIMYEVLPADVPRAVAADDHGKGWGCFGEAGVGRWLSVWAPGHGLEMTPVGTGLPMPPGSRIVMQVHYNLFRGDRPTHVRLLMQTVPASRAHLAPLSVDPVVAPPDIPCPAGVVGPLCDRAASIDLLGKQWGALAVLMVDGIEQACGHDPSDPPGGDTATCTSTVGYTGKILRIQPHMHLLGTGMEVVLDAGTARQRVLLDDRSYDFDYQRSFDMPAPVSVTPTDTLTVTCTYDPRLARELPQLRRLPPRYVTWGEGSANEMCLAVVSHIP